MPIPATSSGRTSSSSPPSRSTAIPALGYGATSMRRISSLTRSTERIEVLDACARIASIVPGREREAEPGDESSCPVHAQRILGEGLGRIERRAQHPGEQVGEPLAGDVDHLAVEASGRARSP